MLTPEALKQLQVRIISSCKQSERYTVQHMIRDLLNKHKITFFKDADAQQRFGVWEDLTALEEELKAKGVLKCPSTNKSC